MNRFSIWLLCLVAGCGSADAPRVKPAPPPPKVNSGPPPELSRPLKNERGALTMKVLESGYVLEAKLTARTKLLAVLPDLGHSIKIESEPAGLYKKILVFPIYSFHHIQEMDKGTSFTCDFRLSAAADASKSEDGVYRCRLKYSDQNVNDRSAGKVELSTMGHMHSNEFYVHVHNAVAMAYARFEDVPVVPLGIER